MPGRAQSAVYLSHKAHLVERDGPWCIACFVEYGQKRGEPAVKLQIDHADNNPKNWTPSNLHLTCQTHNLKFRSLSVKDHVSLMATYSAKFMCLRAQMGLESSLPKILVDYMAGSPEMQVNSICEVRWLEFMHQEISKYGSIFKEVAIAGGAQVAGCSTAAVRNNYLPKAISPWGAFKETKDGGGNKIIVYLEPMTSITGSLRKKTKEAVKPLTPVTDGPGKS